MSSVVADYKSATPGASQFNEIDTSGAGTTVAITGGALAFTRGASNSGSFSRTTDLSPTPSAIIYTLSLAVSGNTAATTTAAVFQVGTGFGTANGTESNANTYARFGINLSATAGNFFVRDITAGTNSVEFSGSQTITWVLNNAAAPINYTAPDASSPALAPDRADLWVGNTKVLDGVTILTPAQSITDLKFVFSAGVATIAIDNMQISEVPEPGSILLGALGLLSTLRRRR